MLAFILSGQKRPKTNVKYHLSQSDSDRLRLLLDIGPCLTSFGGWVVVPPPSRGQGGEALLRILHVYGNPLSP